MDYKSQNEDYWSGRYEAPNVENFIFRMYGRILKFDYGIDGSKGESVFDFGMGQGGNLHFFHKLGFNVFGVDIAKNDIAFAKKIMPILRSKHENPMVIDIVDQHDIFKRQFYKRKKFYTEQKYLIENTSNIKLEENDFSFKHKIVNDEETDDNTSTIFKGKCIIDLS